MVHLFRIAIWATLAFSIVACQLGVIVIQQPEPEIPQGNFAPFEAMGCEPMRAGGYECPAETLLGSYCNFIYPPNAFIGGLEPALPIAICEYVPGDLNPVMELENYLFASGGLSAFVNRYVILRGNEVEVLGNFEDIQTTYAPITSEIEALSYAVAVTRLVPRYDLKTTDYTFEVTELEETHVISTQDGWVVNLFGYDTFGCGPHYHYGQDVTIMADGTFSRGERVNLFRDAKLDDLCVD